MVVLLCCLICVSRRSTPFRGSSHAPDAKLRMQYDLQTGKIRFKIGREQSPQPHSFTVLVGLDHIRESLFEKHGQYEVALCVQHVVCSSGLEMSFASTVVGTKVIVHLLAAAVASATGRATSPASRRAAPRSCRSRSSPASCISLSFSCKLRVPVTESLQDFVHHHHSRPLSSTPAREDRSHCQ